MGMALEHYGLVAGGVVIEGDATLLAASFLCHQGHLQFLPVLLVGALTSTTVNNVLFWASRCWARPCFQRKLNANTRWLRLERSYVKHQLWVLLFSRFIWGLRVAIITAAGLSTVRYPVFVVLDLLGAFLWATVLCLGGYYFGEALTGVLADIRAFDLHIALALFVGVGLLVGYRSWAVRKKRRLAYEALAK
jgi:membrane protein DedA with SNARE-associated domain